LQIVINNGDLQKRKDKKMDLITLLVIVIVLAIVFWLLTKYVLPAVPAPWGTIILVVVALIVIVWLLQKIGII